MKIPLLLLHGAIGASDELQPLAERLRIQHDIYLMDFPGHGGVPMPMDKFSIPFFGEAVLEFAETRGWKKFNVFGYSMGGYVAMYVARHHAPIVNKIITFGTKFQWDVETAEREKKMLNPDTIMAKVPAFAKALEERHHAAGWKTVLHSTAEMLTAMGKDNPLSADDFAELRQPALLIRGDRDKVVSMTETENVLNRLPHGQMAVLPGTPHPFDRVDAALLSYLVEQFLRK